jgi:hypothetical protein
VLSFASCRHCANDSEVHFQASYWQTYIDTKWHDIRHVGEGAELNHLSRIYAKRAARIVRMLVQAGAEQPASERQMDWCAKCNFGKS